MTAKDAQVEDALRELDEMLTVAPAEDFAARVRAKVATQPKPTSTWHSSWWLAAAAIFLVVLGGRTLWIRHQAPSLPRPTPTAETTRAGAGAQPVPPVTPSAVATRIELPRARRTSSRSGPSGGSASPVSSHELEVLVPPDQRIALTSIVRALEDNRIDGAVLVPAEPKGPLPGPVFERIEFAPLVFVTVTVPPMDDEGRIRSRAADHK